MMRNSDIYKAIDMYLYDLQSCISQLEEIKERMEHNNSVFDEFFCEPAWESKYKPSADELNSIIAKWAEAHRFLQAVKDLYIDGVPPLSPPKGVI